MNLKMHNKNKRKSKYLIIILILAVLFFILFDIQTEENSKSGINIEKVNSKLYQNYQNKNLETQQSTNSTLADNEETKKDKQSTTNEENVEKEYLESEFKGYKVCAKLNIPIINLETYVLEEYSKQALLTSVTKFYGGEPNKVGNFCIAGHNYGPLNMFQNIKKLTIDDEIYLTDTHRNKIKYIIYDIYTVMPEETECLSQKTDGNIELTLITCTLDSEKRIIIKAIKE